MDENAFSERGLQMLIEDYAHFIRENYLRELAGLQLDLVMQMDVPILKLIPNLGRDQMMESGINSLRLQLTAFEEGRGFEHLTKGLRDWEQDKLEGGIPKSALQPTDLIYIYAAQRQALIQLIPHYFKEADKAINLAIEISNFYTLAENEAFKVLFKIREEAEDALKESEERFRSISESTTDAILVADKDLEIIYCNTAANRITQFSANELGRLNIQDVLVGNEENWQQLLGDLSHNESSVSSLPDLFVISKDESRIPVDIALSHWHTEEGSFYGFIIHDISLRKTFEEELKRKADELDRSNNALQQFAYVASHDMREPLRMITSFLQLLERKHRDKLPEEAIGYVNMSLDGAKRLSNLINDLLNYSRVNSGKPNLKETDLNEIMEEVMLNLSEVIKDKNVKVELNNLPEKMIADPIKFAQLFQNLIANAIKFNNKPQPIIRIWTEDKASKWQFNVQDNGIGMTQEQLDQAFIMFRRLHGKEYPGTGIGLALCKRIVEQHNGTIWVESEPEKGTTFHFTIPKKIVQDTVLTKTM
jgi:PAS domain S-box-containing protein